MNTNSKCCCDSPEVPQDNAARRVMFIGNPNSGKSTLFNRLCNLHVRTGNYPGVTVARHTGRYSSSIQMVDLPGIYSLSSASAEEIIARDELLNGRCDLIVNIVDATSLERSMYLSMELRELGLPMLLLLNMWDDVEKEGISIDAPALEKDLGCRVIPVSATRGDGIKELREYLNKGEWQALPPLCPGNQKFVTAINEITAGIAPAYEKRASFLAASALLGDRIPEDCFKNPDTAALVENHRASLAADTESGSIYEALAAQRYGFISEFMSRHVKVTPHKKTLTEKLDAVVLNRFMAPVIFVAVMFFVYFISVTWLGSILTDWTNDTLFGEMIIPWTKEMMEKLEFSELAASLVSDGIVGGVGAVLGFVPQMIILFLMLALLEECGYMTRAAFFLDRVFNFFGLSGRAFIPYIIGTGCGVPALMTVRTLPEESERRVTLFTATMIPCSAKLPIIVLFASAIFSDYAWFPAAIYFTSVAIIIISALIMQKFQDFKSSPAPMLMEMPLYHIPSPRVVLLTVYQRVRAFIKKAGTIIFACCVVIWTLSSLGYSSEEGIHTVSEPDESILADVAQPVSVVFAPLGFDDYRATVATVSGLSAKEVVVSTLSVFAGAEEDAIDSEEDEVVAGLYEKVRNNIFHIDEKGAAGLLAALSFVLFNLFTVPCVAAVGTLHREIGGGRLFWYAIAYQLGFSYGFAFIVYQLAMLMAGYGFGIMTGIALVLLGVFLFLMFRKGPSESSEIPFVMVTK